ncbi:MAG TPA: MFS transporter [Pseudonocardiaceae bacterium]|jgi:EmrB/QacA subfamily drug resistance transporter|nr:MFS transporter [Pseudonocardiaceae bacterium]
MDNLAVDHPRRPETRRWPALVICLVASFMTLLDVSVVTIALPSMEHNLHLSPAAITWTVAGYALAFGLTLVPAGRLGDEYGRRRLLLIGLSLFAVTGLICGIAPNATVLIIGRLLRGVSAGILAPQVIGLLQVMYPKKTRGRAFGYYGATTGLSTAVGPILGGVILQSFGPATGWRWIFYLSIPIVVLALAIGVKVLPADRRGQAHRLDFLGVALLGLGVFSIMLPMLQETGVDAHPRFWLFAVGIVLLVLFVLWQRRLGARNARPLVHLKVLRIRSYAVGTAVATTFYTGFTAIFLVLTLFLQQGLKYTPLHAALATLIFTVVSACCAVLSGRLVHRVGRPLVLFGTGIATLGLIATALIARGSTVADAPLALAVPLAIAGGGCGLVISANQTLTLVDITRPTAGVAAGVYETGVRVGTALGTAIAGALYFGTLAGTHGNYHVAVAVGLISPAVMVGVAFLIGLVDALWPAKANVATVDSSEIPELYEQESLS